jgi:ABC-type nitrate/sulfonate/bicarbonate transport system substrate-binding protein
VRIIASVQDKLAGSIYARPEIKTPEDLKGKKLGISRFGAVSETAAAMFLARFGLKRGTDVAIIQLGGLPRSSRRWKEAVDAGFAILQTSRARRIGMKELLI